VLSHRASVLDGDEHNLMIIKTKQQSFIIIIIPGIVAKK
jgi:hypothetical protein